MLTLSTMTATPLCSKTLSSSFAWSSASAYWKPEQPPPRTATLSADSSSLPREATRSLIFAAAPSVRATAAVGVSTCFRLYRHMGAASASVASVRPLQVLQDPLRVVDHLIAVDDHRDPALTGELLDLRPGRAAIGEPHDAVVEAEPAQAAGDRAARAEDVGPGRASVEDYRRPLAAGRIASRPGPPRRHAPLVRSPTHG